MILMFGFPQYNYYNINILMRSHSIFQEQKLTVLAPLTSSIGFPVKSEQSFTGNGKSLLRSARRPGEEIKAAETKKHLVKQKTLNKVQNEAFLGKGSLRSVFPKKLGKSFFVNCPPAFPLDIGVGSKVEKLTREQSPVDLSYSMQTFLPSNKSTQNKKLIRKVFHSSDSLSFASYANFFIELIKLQKRETSKPVVQVILAFSSFEKKDLNSAFHLFQNYLTNLTNRLTAYNCFEKGLPLYYKRVNQNLIPQFANVSGQISPQSAKKVSCKKTLSLSLQSYGPLITEGILAAKQSKEKIGAQLSTYGTTLNQKKLLIKRKTLVTSVVRAVRALNEPLRATSIPLPTQLYTVIRSPHVFKKTREQFATTQYKRVIKLCFRSNAALQLLVDSLILLKLPAEVKVVIRDL